MSKRLSDQLRHFFHVVSNIRPIVWIGLYIALIPVYALVYWWLPDGQFRIPDGAGTDFGSWLYYSIVSITTLGFGDYTPSHGLAQFVTALEVMCGLIILGLFLNAVGSMKSEIDVESEIEKQRRLHQASEKDKLTNNVPILLHKLNQFIAYCYAVTTPADKRSADPSSQFNEDFTFSDLADLDKPSDLPFDHSGQSAVNALIRSGASTALYLDSLQNRIDLTLWPELLEDCFAFVAKYQMFSSSDSSLAANPEASAEIKAWEGHPGTPTGQAMQPYVELYNYIKEAVPLVRKIESAATTISAN